MSLEIDSLILKGNRENQGSQMDKVHGSHCVLFDLHFFALVPLESRIPTAFCEHNGRMMSRPSSPGSQPVNQEKKREGDGENDPFRLFNRV